jgi:type I restriction enzyme R subunit
MKFIERMTPSPDVPDTQEETDIDDEWKKYIEEQREADLATIITEEKLRPEETRKFMEQSFTDGFVTTTGVAITKVLPPMPIFGGGASKREVKKRTVLEKLTAFFHKYMNV